MDKANLDRWNILGRINEIQLVLEQLKRDVIKCNKPLEKAEKLSLFGSIKSGDITEDMIEEAKKSLFRELEDV